mmetsp:Transcript_19104/g.47752  ORF Transcript_19104/g.47752 Transcript_19104/m.47752 type:complete len:90 (+) Transcript_19104:101-370(+)
MGKESVGQEVWRLHRLRPRKVSMMLMPQRILRSKWFNRTTGHVGQLGMHLNPLVVQQSSQLHHKVLVRVQMLASLLKQSGTRMLRAKEI